MSCTDLIITDQPNLFVNFGVHFSLDDHCRHQIIHGKFNISVPIPPPYLKQEGVLELFISCPNMWHMMF